MNASAAQTCARSARSENNVSADASTTAAPHSHISVSKACRNPVVTSFGGPGSANPGIVKAKSAPGGYSTAKSRYGTLPSVIALP